MVLITFLSFCLLDGAAMRSLWAYMSNDYAPIVRIVALLAGVLTLPCIFYLAVIV